MAAAIAAAIVASIAARVQLLPDVIDISIIPTGAGIGSLALAFYGALRRFDPDRIGRLALFGTLLGGIGAAVSLVVALVADVLSSGALAYGFGGPAWLVYAAILLAVLAVLPGYNRWDERHHS